jgi:hypothetical protein
MFAYTAARPTLPGVSMTGSMSSRPGKFHAAGLDGFTDGTQAVVRPIPGLIGAALVEKNQIEVHPLHTSPTKNFTLYAFVNSGSRCNGLIFVRENPL